MATCSECGAGLAVSVTRGTAGMPVWDAEDGAVCPSGSGHMPEGDCDVKYQVTATKPGEDVQVIAEFGNGYDAGEFARKFFTTRAASGKAVTVRRTDGQPA